MNEKNSLSDKFIVYSSLGILAFLALIVFKPFAIIKAGDRGVVMRFGKVQNTILDEGIHVIIPVVNSIKPLTVRVQKNDVTAAASSKDLQDVNIEIALNWHINPEKANTIFQRIGDEEQIVNRIIEPAVSEIVKAASAQKNAEEIITKRNEVKQQIDI